MIGHRIIRIEISGNYPAYRIIWKQYYSKIGLFWNWITWKPGYFFYPYCHKRQNWLDISYELDYPTQRITWKQYYPDSRLSGKPDHIESGLLENRFLHQPYWHVTRWSGNRIIQSLDNLQTEFSGNRIPRKFDIQTPVLETFEWK